MDLLRQICRSNWTGINVQSDEAKRAVMVLAILADVFSLHKTHIGSEREGVRESCASPGPTNLGIADDTIKVSDL